tara:strand:- start:741 stop:1541 length:801 start_codon:yes stop_codon:yes gene_type:complete
MADSNTKTGALAAWAGGGGVPANKEAVAAALLASAGAGQTGSDAMDYMSFSGQGANYAGWKLGRDKVAPDPDAVFIIDPLSNVEGWNCWVGGAVKEKHEWGVFDRNTAGVDASDLKDYGPYKDGDGWQFMLGVSMFDIDAADRQIKFTTTSKSGKNVLADLTGEVAKRIIDDDPYVPVVRLSSEKFTAQGKINGKPMIVVDGWVTMPEVSKFLEMADEGDYDDLLSGKYVSEANEVPVEEPVETVSEAEPVDEPVVRKKRARRPAA